MQKCTGTLFFAVFACKTLRYPENSLSYPHQFFTLNFLMIILEFLVKYFTSGHLLKNLNIAQIWDCGGQNEKKTCKFLPVDRVDPQRKQRHKILLFWYKIHIENGFCKSTSFYVFSAFFVTSSRIFP